MWSIFFIVAPACACAWFARDAKANGMHGWVAIFLALCAAGSFLSVWCAVDVARDQAVQAGHAEVVDGEWRWLPPCDNPSGCAYTVPSEEGK